MGRALLLMTGLLVVGCAAPGGSADEDGSLAASLEAKVRNDSVNFTLHVTNTGDEAQTFRFPSSQRYDIAVEDARGEPVWRWSDGMAFTQAITSAELEPGETWTFEATWATGRSGTYRATGWLTAEERDVRQSTSFELP